MSKEFWVKDGNCFSFLFQFDGQDVLVPYTHYQRNKGMEINTVYSVRSDALAKMQETSCPVLNLAMFLQSKQVKRTPQDSINELII